MGLSAASRAESPATQNTWMKVLCLGGALFVHGFNEEAHAQDKVDPSASQTLVVRETNKDAHAERSAEIATLQTHVEELKELLPTASLAYLEALLSRVTVGDTLALDSRDFFGASLVENLKALSLAECHPSLKAIRESVLTSFLQELAEPGELNQDRWGVCGVSLIYPLYLEHPAEAARLMCALISQEGRCLLKDGSAFERAPFSMDDDAPGARTHSERLMMSALMERANGALLYCDICDTHFDSHTGQFANGGLTTPQILTLYQAIYGVRYAALSRSVNSADTMRIVLESEARKSRFVPVSIKWMDVEGGGSSYSHKSPSESPLIPHRRILSQEIIKSQVQVHHLVLVRDIDESRVYFRNLHGATPDPKGTLLQNPPRRIEDPQRGVQSMERGEFFQRLAEIYRP
jgi:hypothetical protein